MAVASEFSLGSVETALSPQERFEEFLTVPAYARLA